MSLFLKPQKQKHPVAPGEHFSNKTQITRNTIIKESNMSSLHSLKNCKGTPLCASLRKASYTIEAAVILPVFLTLMMFGIFFFRVLQIQTGVQQSIEMASRSFALISEENKSASKAQAIAYADLLIKENKVPVSFVNAGYLGFNYAKSEISDDYVDLKVKYNIEFPIKLLGNLSYTVTQEAKTRKWVGYDPNEKVWDGVYVYLADYSEVYHSDSNCTYLNPQIKEISEEEIETIRNLSGHKYYECSLCKKKGNSGGYYVTDYGTCYHTSLDCSSLKRNIRKVLLEEAKAKYPPCSKCVGK